MLNTSVLILSKTVNETKVSTIVEYYLLDITITY